MLEVGMSVQVIIPNRLRFWDGSEFELNDVWVQALHDKLKHNKKTLQEFLEEFGLWLRERWETRTCSSKFGIRKWDDLDEFDYEVTKIDHVSDLAEIELYHYLRAWILGLALGKAGGKVLILTKDGIVEYP
jgi:hypothetical protein